MSFILIKKKLLPLEYYEENFVWGKLQRTDEEYPYHMVFTAVKTGIRTAAGNMADMKTGVPVRGVCGELLIILLILPSIINSTG